MYDYKIKHAQANVFPTFKRTGDLGTATTADKAKSQEKVLAVKAGIASGQSRFMPLQRDGVGQSAAGAARLETSTTSMSELKARNKFAPGPRGYGGESMTPAALAAVTAVKTPAGESARVATAPAKLCWAPSTNTRPCRTFNKTLSCSA